MSKNTKKKSSFKKLEKLGLSSHSIRVLEKLTMTFERIPVEQILLDSELKILKSYGFQEGDTLESIRGSLSEIE